MADAEMTFEEYFDSENQEVSSAWRIETLVDADWALKRLGDLRREIEANEAIFEANVHRLRLRTDALNEKTARGMRFFESHLKAYAERNRAELCPGKKKSRELAHGTIQFRKAGGNLVVEDKDKLLTWVKAQGAPELLRVSEAPAVEEVKRRFKSTGELPDGCNVEAEREEIKLQTSKELSDVE